MNAVAPAKLPLGGVLKPMSSKSLRLLFFGMFRKGPLQSLDSILNLIGMFNIYLLTIYYFIMHNLFNYNFDDFNSDQCLSCHTSQAQVSPRFNKKELIESMTNDYIALGKILDRKSPVDVIRDVEVELSKNTQFKVMKLGSLANLTSSVKMDCHPQTLQVNDWVWVWWCWLNNCPCRYPKVTEAFCLSLEGLSNLCHPLHRIANGRLKRLPSPAFPTSLTLSTSTGAWAFSRKTALAQPQVQMKLLTWISHESTRLRRNLQWRAMDRVQLQCQDLRIKVVSWFNLNSEWLCLNS